MKTSKNDRVAVLRKAADNIENDLYCRDGIQFYSSLYRCFQDLDPDLEQDYGAVRFDFNNHNYRVKPQTITINGVEIPKPLGSDEILEDEVYYHVDNSEFLYEARHGEFIADHGIRFVYETKEEAIEASKLLFGIED